MVLEPLTVARAFVRGEYCPSGDLITAVQEQLSRGRPGLWSRLLGLYARLGPGRWLSQSLSLQADARKLRFHYDRSNEFYKQFLDKRLVYSCAYFSNPNATLEEAQVAKLDLICRKLDLQKGERLLDIGCGWGALLVHAAQNYGVRATGCTVSQPQAEEAFRRACGEGLHEKVQVLEVDYRRVQGRFEKVASVGMFEHVGPRGLRAYFKTVRGLMSSEGLFLNHGIVRPQPERDSAETLFLGGKPCFPSAPSRIWRTSSGKRRTRVSRSWTSRTCVLTMHGPAVNGCGGFNRRRRHACVWPAPKRTGPGFCTWPRRRISST